MSVSLLSIIVYYDGLKKLCSKVGNEFIQTKINEKVCAQCGPVFEDNKGYFALIVIALYGLTTSVE